ncbi:peptidyl-prolyl cis-trans isomerase 6-like [Trichogramma pretiosum]|uniref:peptidyl-prolyl cis-trans isomerase 6-like n=1 Tax=Trichogramma pretiosum TaxID=7493 RepID=UPI0006C992EC|nr:peptidyl-prolyl cis-trans isomerase 6-like [Trichogramma pretiosum]
MSPLVAVAAIALLITTDYAQATRFTITDQVYFDIMIGDNPAGRMVIGLFGEDTPKTVKNFMTLASEGIEGKTYAGSKFHRVIKKFMVQGGDIEKNDGSGSISIYGKYFDNENFKFDHVGPGMVSMANAGKDTNGCQFFITTIATPWLDGQHTVFGKVVDGMDVVFKIENTRTDVDDHPILPVVIQECGILPTYSPYTVSDNPYDLWAWTKAACIPLSFSFAVLGFFHWMMKQLDC